MAKARQFVSWSCGVLVRHQPMSPLAASRPCPQPAAAGCVAADPQGLFAFASGRVARPFPSEGCASAQPEDRSPASAAGAGLSPAPRLRSVPAPPRLVADGHRCRVGAMIPPALRYLRVLMLDRAPAVREAAERAEREAALQAELAARQAAAEAKARRDRELEEALLNTRKVRKAARKAKKRSGK